MLATIESINNVVNNFIWGVPAMICIVGVGLLLSIRTGFLQIRKFPYAMKVTIGRMLKKREATILDLEGEPLYLENSSFKLNEFIQSRCWNRGFEPDIVFETNGFDLCYKMCRLKRGISVTIDFVHEDMNTEGLVMIPFAEDDMIWEIGLLTLKDRAMESSVEKFYKYIENYNN